MSTESLDALPREVKHASDLTALQAVARRFELACGGGTMVWHAWGHGDPVVLLHGGAGSWTHWVRNIAALEAAGRSVWIPDMPGFGDSTAITGAHDADALPAPLEAALAELLGEQACDFVAFSFGAMVGALIAVQHPTRVRRLVLVGAPALGVPPASPIELKSWRHLESEAERNAVHRHNLGLLMLHDPASADAFAIALQATNAARDRMKRRRLSRTDLLLRALHEVRCPVFGIWGAHDALYRGRTALVEPALRAASAFSGLRWIEHAGHWVQFERSAAFDQALSEVLR